MKLKDQNNHGYVLALKRPFANTTTKLSQDWTFPNGREERPLASLLHVGQPSRATLE